MSITSVTDELKRLHNLLKQGAITQKEYDAYKKKLLQKNIDIHKNPKSNNVNNPTTNIQYHIHQTKKEERRVGILLFLGIIIFPFLFVWFLFRPGHSGIARVLGILYLLFGIAFVRQDYRNYINRVHGNEVVTSSSSAQPVKLSTFSSLDLETAYSQNTVKADMQFKNKRFIITGMIDSINTDITNTPYVTMASHNLLSGVMAKFKRGQEQKIASLVSGQAIKLDCIGAGDVAKVPMVQNCVIL